SSPYIQQYPRNHRNREIEGSCYQTVTFESGKALADFKGLIPFDQLFREWRRWGRLIPKDVSAEHRGVAVKQFLPLRALLLSGLQVTHPSLQLLVSGLRLLQP